MTVRCIGAVVLARKRTRVVVVKFHVSLYPISVSLLLSFLYARQMSDAHALTSLYSADRSQNSSSSSYIPIWVSVTDWLRRFALKLLAPLRCCWGSNTMRGSWQLLTEASWFTHRNNVFLKLWKLTSIYNTQKMKNGVEHNFINSTPPPQ